jgi:hypothetical protein
MSRREQLIVRDEAQGFFRAFQRFAFIARVTPNDLPEHVQKLDLKSPEISQALHSLLTLAFYRAFEGVDASRISNSERKDRAQIALANFNEALSAEFAPVQT